MSTHPTPPRHFRPQSSSQRLELLRRIDETELAAMQSTPPSAPPAPSEGARSVEAITEAFRTGAIRLERDPMTRDPLRLLPETQGPTRRVHVPPRPMPAPAPPLRLIRGKPPARAPQFGGPLNCEPDQNHDSNRYHPHRPPTLDAFERRAVALVVGVCLLLLALLALAIYS